MFARFIAYVRSLYLPICICVDTQDFRDLIEVAVHLLLQCKLKRDIYSVKADIYTREVQRNHKYIITLTGIFNDRQKVPQNEPHRENRTNGVARKGLSPKSLEQSRRSRTTDSCHVPPIPTSVLTQGLDRVAEVFCYVMQPSIRPVRLGDSSRWRYLLAVYTRHVNVLSSSSCTKAVNSYDTSEYNAT